MLKRVDPRPKKTNCKYVNRCQNGSLNLRNPMTLTIVPWLPTTPCKLILTPTAVHMITSSRFLNDNTTARTMTCICNRTNLNRIPVPTLPFVPWSFATQARDCWTIIANNVTYSGVLVIHELTVVTDTTVCIQARCDGLQSSKSSILRTRQVWPQLPISELFWAARTY